MDPITATALDIIRRSIHTQGTTPAVLARRAGLGHDTVYRWLSGQRSPRADDLDRVLQQLGYRLSVTRAL